MFQFESFSPHPPRVLAGMTLVFLLSGLALLPHAYAQRGGRPAMDRDEFLNREMTAIAEHVSDLNDQQSEQIRVIVGEQFDKQEELNKQMRSGGEDARQSMREKMTELRNEMSARIEAVLSKDQFAQFTEYQKSQEAARGQRGARNGRQGGSSDR